ncbi:hypothetical protein MUP77_26085 [Candidatus Bathyarchaeota archaeon]|nr:hypothetical protein [Candidatus Bathyarchaeota archaeon]
MDWSVILTTIAAIGTMGSFIVGFYRWVYCRHKERTTREKEEIYKPLHRDIETLVNSTKNFEEEKCEQPLAFWKSLWGKVPSDLYSRLEGLFEKRFREYCNWLKASQDFIRYKIYFYVTMHLTKLDGEFKNLGVGSFEYKLYGSLMSPILHGESISLTWFKEHDLSLWEEVERCPHSKDIRNLLEWLKEHNPCIESLRKAQKDLLKSAETLSDELKRKIN